MKKTMKKFAAVVLAGAMALSLCACQGGQAKKDLTKITVALDWAPNTNHTGLYVAQEMGFFEEQGLDVTIVQPSEDGATMMVATNQAQFGIDFQDTLAATFTAEEEIPVTAVAAVLQHNTSGIISLKENGIDSFGKMTGHNYATWESPIEQGILKTVINNDGGNFDEVELIPEYVTDVVSGLQADIDTVWIFYGWDGVATELAGLDTNYIYFKDVDPTFDYYSPVIIANNDFIAENDDTTKKFLAAVYNGYAYAADYPEEAAEILCKNVPELDHDMVVASQKYLSEQYIADASQWGYIDPTRWDGFYKYLYENGLSDEIPAGFGFTNEYLPPAK